MGEPSTAMLSDARRTSFQKTAVRVCAFAAMVAVALCYRADRLTDWDSWDYAAQAAHGWSSGLCLGRWWFIAVMRGGYLAGQLLGLSPIDGYRAMQATSAILMGLAVVVAMAWARRLSGPRGEGILGSLMILAPMFGAYGSSVMTEGLAILMLAAAMLLWEQGLAQPDRAIRLALAGGLCFGIAADVREPAALLCAWPVTSCVLDRSFAATTRRRWAMLAAAVGGTAVTLGAGVAGAIAWSPDPAGYFAGVTHWARSMADERLLFPVSPLANGGTLAWFLLLAAPGAAVLALPALAWAFVRRRRLFWLATSTTPYTLSLLGNHDLNVNPRFVLPLLLFLLPAIAAALEAFLARFAKGLLARAGGAALAAGAISAVALFVAAPLVEWSYFRHPREQSRLYQSLTLLPDDAVVIPGPGTPVAWYLNNFKAKRFDIVSSGWAWPGENLRDLVARAAAAGRCVYANLQDGGWSRQGRKSGEVELVDEIARSYRQEAAGWPMVRLLPKTTR